MHIPTILISIISWHLIVFVYLQLTVYIHKVFWKSRDPTLFVYFYILARFSSYPPPLFTRRIGLTFKDTLLYDEEKKPR